MAFSHNSKVYLPITELTYGFCFIFVVAKEEQLKLLENANAELQEIR